MSRHKLIGIVAKPDFSFDLGIIDGVSRYALEAGDWVLDTTWSVPSLPLEVVPKWHGDGLVGNIDLKLAATLRRRKMPFVNISSWQENPPTPSVIVDNRAVGRRAAEHLISKGLKDLGVVVRYPGHHMELRFEGFAECAAENGLSCTRLDATIVTRPSGTLVFECRPLRAFLSRRQRPVGIFAGDDPMARATIQAVVGLGLRVPEDVAVMGEGNWRFICDMVTPRLTSVDIGSDRIGYLAARLLDTIMSGGPLPKEPTLVQPKGVQPRESTDLLAIDDDLVREALRFIREHAALPIQAGDILDAVPVNRRTLEKRFRRALGRSIHDEIRRSHIELACRLLSSTDMPVNRIIAACGYVTQDRFHAAFRREMKITPSTYRSRHRGT